jgi:hypothetical protein
MSAASEGRAPGRLAQLRDVFVDNPLLERDARVALRSRRTVVAVGGIALLATVVSLILVGSAAGSFADLATYGLPEPWGRILTAVIAGGALGILSLALPAAGAVAVATERERGTLKLLLISAMTPGQVAVGKLGALVGTGAPVLLVALPFLALGSWFGDVGPLDIVGLWLLLAFNALVAGAAGLWSGAYAQRVRTATGPALLSAGVLVWVPVAIPSAVLIVLWGAGELDVRALPYAVLSVGFALVVAAATLVGARGAIAPARQARRRFRGPVVTAALVAVPALTALSLVVLSSRERDEEAYANVLLFGLLLLGLGTVVVDVAAAGRGPDERAPLGAFVSTSVKALLGASLAAAVTLLALDVVNGSLQDEWILQAGAGALSFGLGLSCAAALTAVVATVFATPKARVAVTGCVLALVAVAPPLLGLAKTLLLGQEESAPLLLLNPLAQLASVARHLDLLDLPYRLAHWPDGVPLLYPGLAAYGGLLAIALVVLLSRRPR